MITYREACAKIRAYVRNLSALSALDLVVMEELTIERDFGWVFIYDVRKVAGGGASTTQIAGNSPLIVDRRNGSLHEAGTTYPVEHYIDNYEKYGDPFGPSV